MRAMILAAGLGTRLQPLTSLRAKPALPVLGRPVIGFLLQWLHGHGVREVFVNLHHLAESIRDAAERFRPPDMQIEYAYEANPLGTGGGIRQAQSFLRQSNPAIVLAGDMLFDADLTTLVQHHKQRNSTCTLVLRRDPRIEAFGSIGLDSDQRIRRIAERFDLGEETDAGLFTGLRLLSPSFFDLDPHQPPGLPFEDLSDWIAPALKGGNRSIHGHILEPAESVWAPVGTPAEYLDANLRPPKLSYLQDDDLKAQGTTLRPAPQSVVIGAGASLGEDAQLERCVIWEGEHVPAGFRGRGGVFAEGRFYALENAEQPSPNDRSRKP